MHIVLFGSRGSIGSAIATEAVNRGHTVTGVVRDTATPGPAGVRQVAGDALDRASIAAVAKGADIVASAIGPRASDGPTATIDAGRALVAGTQAAGVKRLIIVGGAGSLRVPSGKQLIELPDFPAEYKAVATAHNALLQTLKAEAGALEWTYFSPAAMIAPGPRTGKFRLGGDHLVADAKGESAISIADYAIAFVDEIERGAHARQQMTAAY